VVESSLYLPKDGYDRPEKQDNADTSDYAPLCLVEEIVRKPDELFCRARLPIGFFGHLDYLALYQPLQPEPLCDGESHSKDRDDVEEGVVRQDCGIPLAIV
jgi:hypothetical protein